MDVLAPEIPEKINSRFAGLIDAVKNGWFLEDEDQYFKGFHISESNTVVDVGCGDGNASLFCANRGARVIFTDVDDSSIDSLLEKMAALDNPPQFEGIVCDSDPLPIKDCTADRVMCMEVLEHVENPMNLMGELVRIGTPGALYLLSVPGERGEHIQRQFAPKEYFQPPNHIRIFSENDFRQLVESAGLEIISYTPTGFFWVMWMSMYWAVQAATGESYDAAKATHLQINPPFEDNLNRWAALWIKFTSTPEGLAFKREMDLLLPKNQVIVARKKAE